MTKHSTVFPVALLALALALIGAIGIGSAQAPTGATTGNAIEGQQLYYDYSCYGCHGYNGETGRRALIGSGFLSNEAAFITYLRLRAEQNPILPSTQMPNYPANSLSDAQARDIYAYVKTFERSAPALEDIPTLQAIIEAASRPYEP